MTDLYDPEHEGFVWTWDAELGRSVLRAIDDVGGSIEDALAAEAAARIAADAAEVTARNNAIAALVNSAPSTLNTLKELSDALAADPNFATTITTALGLKAPIDSPTFTGSPVAPTLEISGKNGLALRRFVGHKATPGAPTTGTWAVGDEVTDSDGVVWTCTVAGTPGTFSRPNATSVGIGAAYYGSAAQTANTSVATAITLDTVIHDSTGFWAVGQPTRLTVPAGYGGLFLVHGAIRYASNGTGVRHIQIRRNGTDYRIVDERAAVTPGSGSDQAGATGACPMRLADGDYVEALAYQDSGSNLALGTSIFERWLALTRIGS